MWSEQASEQQQRSASSGDHLTRTLDQGHAGLGLCGEPDQALPGVSQLQAQLPDALRALPAGEMATAAPDGACSSQATAEAPARASTAFLASCLHKQSVVPGASLGAAAIQSSAAAAMPTRAAAQEAALPSASQQAAGAGARSEVELGQAQQEGAEQAPLVFVSNDWPCAPLALRLRHTIQCAQVPLCESAASQVPGAASEAPAGLQHNSSGGNISSGAC
jgi:hypothetical protein